MTRVSLGISICIGLIALGANGFARFDRQRLNSPTPRQVNQLRVDASHAQQTETPEQVVRYFLGLPHGLYKLSPEDRTLLKRVTDNPTPYVAALKSVYAGKNVATVRDHEEGLRFVRAVALLAFIGTNEALSQIVDWYKALDKPDVAFSATQRDKALYFKRVILSSLDTAKQDEIITSILGTLVNMDYATRIASLEYLSRSAANDERVINELRKLLNDPRSPLYQDRVLKRSLESLSKPK